MPRSATPAVPTAESEVVGICRDLLGREPRIEPLVERRGLG